MWSLRRAYRSVRTARKADGYIPLCKNCVISTWIGQLIRSRSGRGHKLGGTVGPHRGSLCWRDDGLWEGAERGGGRGAGRGWLSEGHTGGWTLFWEPGSYSWVLSRVWCDWVCILHVSLQLPWGHRGRQQAWTGRLLMELLSFFQCSLIDEEELS